MRSRSIGFGGLLADVPSAIAASRPIIPSSPLGCRSEIQEACASRIAHDGGSRLMLAGGQGSLELPADRDAVFIGAPLRSRPGKSLGRQEAANLLHCEIDLQVDCKLPQLFRRAARVTHDSVLRTMRSELHLAISGGVTDDGISHCGGNQVPADPRVALV